MKLKTHMLTGSMGMGKRTDWSDATRDFRAIEVYQTSQAGHGFQHFVFTETNPEFLEVVVLKDYPIDRYPGLVLVEIKSNLTDQVLPWSKKPYKNKAGMTNANADMVWLSRDCAMSHHYPFSRLTRVGETGTKAVVKKDDLFE